MRPREESELPALDVEKMAEPDVGARRLTAEPRLRAPRLTATRAASEIASRAREIPRWVMPALLSQLVFLGVVLAAAHFVAERIDQLEDTSRVERQQIEDWAKRAESVAAETAALKSETMNMRQSLFSSVSEDVLFLKTLILKRDIDPSLARQIAHHAHRYAQQQGRDPNLVLAIISVESNFEPTVVSSVGAVGLMQVMPQWKKVLSIEGDLSEVDVSIKYGLQVLGFYLEMYKDLETALTAYNRGPGPVDMALMRGKDPTNKYAPRVLAVYERLKNLSVGVSAEVREPATPTLAKAVEPHNPPARRSRGARAKDTGEDRTAAR